MKYNVIIPIYNIERRGTDRLDRQIASIANGSYPWAAMYVVDGSVEKSIEAESVCAEYPDVIYIHYPQQIFNKSVLYNVGIRKCEADYIVLSDLDSLYSPNFMSKVKEVFDKKPDAFITSISYYLPQETDYNGMLDASWWKKHKEITGRGIDTACGGIQAAKRTWWTKIGGCDERYVRLGAMDGDTLKRAHLTNLNIVWLDRLGGTTLFHQWHEVTKWKTQDDLGWLEKNRELFYGDETAVRNIRGWCESGKYKVKARILHHDNVLDRALNILGCKPAEPADIYIGEYVEGKFCINPYAVSPIRIGTNFERHFGYGYMNKPEHASSVYCIYIFGEIIYAYKRNGRNKSHVPFRNVFSREEGDKIISFMKSLPVDFCEFRVFRCNKNLYIDDIKQNPFVFPEGRMSTTAKRESYAFHKKIADKIEGKLLSGNTRTEPMPKIAISEKALKYLDYLIKGKNTIIYGANELAFHCAKIASKVDVVTGCKEDANWIASSCKSFGISNIETISNISNNYDIVIIDNRFGATHIKDIVEHLKIGGWLIINNYKWFGIGGKFEMEAETRRKVFAWSGINFSFSDNDGGGVAFKQKKS